MGESCQFSSYLFHTFPSSLSQTVVYLVFPCCCALDAHQVRRCSLKTRRRIKGKTPQVSYARLQSDEQPGLPQPSGTAWCSDCSNSCCNVIISGRMCLLRATLLIPAAEDQQGSRWGGKIQGFTSSGFTQLFQVCNLQPGVLASASAPSQL